MCHQSLKWHTFLQQQLWWSLRFHGPRYRFAVKFFLPYLYFYLLRTSDVADMCLLGKWSANRSPPKNRKRIRLNWNKQPWTDSIDSTINHGYIEVHSTYHYYLHILYWMHHGKTGLFSLWPVTHDVSMVVVNIMKNALFTCVYDSCHNKPFAWWEQQLSHLCPKRLLTRYMRRTVSTPHRVTDMFMSSVLK